MLIRSYFSVSVSMYWGILDGSMVKGLPAMQETQEKWVRFLGLEDSPGEGNNNPFQYSYLGNPMDREEASGL